MIFYFTGTGNSLYAASLVESELVSIPQIMRQDELELTAERIGIVAPVYGHEVPQMVRAFMQRAAFHTDYFYMVLTYGNRHGGAAELAQQLCAECGIDPAYINVVLMADNWLPAFDMAEQKQLDKHVEEQLSVIRADLDAGRRMIADVSDADRAAHASFLANMRRMPSDAWQHLIQIKADCTGCGICTHVCPSASLHVEEGRAVFVPGKCQTCLACVHACPHLAIGLSVPEKNPHARYRNPHIALRQIMQANDQK